MAMSYSVNPSVTDYYIDARDRAYPQVEATASHHGLATVVPSVHEGSQSVSSIKRKMVPSYKNTASISQAMQKN